MTTQKINQSEYSIYVTAKEAAELLGVSVPAFTHNFEYPPARSSGQRLWFRDEVEREVVCFREELESRMRLKTGPRSSFRSISTKAVF